MFKGFWGLCAAYKYGVMLKDMSKASVVWLLLLLAGALWTLVELELWWIG